MLLNKKKNLEFLITTVTLSAGNIVKKKLNKYMIINSNLEIRHNEELILNKIDIFENMNVEDNEYTKMYKWINGLSKILPLPWVPVL